VILINTRETTDYSNEQKNEHADALKLYETNKAKAAAAVPETVFTEEEPKITDAVFGKKNRDAYINIMYGNAASLAVSVVSGVLGLLLLA
jgi:hypothetical protein